MSLAFYEKNKVPKDWKLSRLKYIFRFSEETNLQFQNEKNLALTKTGILEKNISSNEGQIAKDYEKYIFIKKGQICMNPMDLLSGWVDISPFNGLISPAYYTLIPKENFDEKFLNYFLQSNYYRETFFTLGKGVASHDNYGRWVLTPEEFKNIFIYYPSLSEQKKISSFLSKKTSNIDSIIKKTQQKISLNKEKILKIFEDILLNQNIKKTRIKYLVKLIERPIKREPNKTYTKIGMYNWGKGIFKYQSQNGSELGDSSFNYLKEGDLLLSGQFSWEGAVSIVEAEHNNCISSHRFHILNSEKSKVLNEYLWTYFTTQEGHFYLNENSKGSAGRNRPLNIDNLLKEKIPVPEMSKQKEIKNLVIENKNYEKLAKKKIEILKEYRKSLISYLITGRVTVPE